MENRFAPVEKSQELREHCGETSVKESSWKGISRAFRKKARRYYRL